MQSSRDEAFVTFNVKLTSRQGIHNLILKVDTGAQGNTLPLATFRKMFPDKLDRNGLPQQEIAKAARDIKLTAYNGTNIPCLGIWSFQCKFQQSRWENTKFHIVDVQGPAVIGLPSSESLKIVTLHCSIKAKPDQGTTTKLAPITSVQDLMRAYPDQFDRIGSLPGEAKLVVDPNVPTHIDPP